MGTTKGLEKYISVEQMKELFEAYVKHTSENPRTRQEHVGREGKKVEVELRVPLTLVGFYNYSYERGGLLSMKDYFSNKDKRYDDYVPICAYIRAVIRQDQIEGGMVGQYNASITQRLNGLKEQQDVNVKSEQPLFGED